MATKSRQRQNPPLQPNQYAPPVTTPSYSSKVPFLPSSKPCSLFSRFDPRSSSKPSEQKAMSSKRSRRSKKKRRRPSSARSKARKPKFMSLNGHLGPAHELARPAPSAAEAQPVDDNDSQQVACLLEESTAPDGRATITDLFGSSTSSSSVVVDEVSSPALPSVEWDGGGLARRALRGRERWVFCRSEVAAVPHGLLQLKLDYEEVMTAWSDRGSLYIDGEEGPPQVVPELRQHRDCCFEDDLIAPTVFVGVGNAGGLRVPEMEVEGKEHKLNREERVMRYKAKRQSRLFSKRIRYEVRKLNAEKRPRIKGRFVKRVDDM